LTVVNKLNKKREVFDPQEHYIPGGYTKVNATNNHSSSTNAQKHEAKELPPWNSPTDRTKYSQ